MGGLRGVSFFSFAVPAASLALLLLSSCRPLVPGRGGARAGRAGERRGAPLCCLCARSLHCSPSPPAPSPASLLSGPYEGGVWKLHVELPEVRPRQGGGETGGRRRRDRSDDASAAFHPPSVFLSFAQAYPYKSPSIGFVNRIYHPNVDEL